MKKIKLAVVVFGVSLITIGQGFSQNALQFTGVSVTPENAIRLSWASNTNEVYEIDYADQLAGNDDGSTAWLPLYNDYPSHGTNTFWLDTGNYNLAPTIPHPKNSPMRFYQIAFQGTNTGPNPAIVITSPANGAIISSNITVTVSATSGQILSKVALFVDGQEMWPSADGSNFVINTCEWWNGPHTLFAVAKSVSHFAGIPNDTSVTYGHGVSPYVNVTFNNLITEVAFSQPYFEPSLGQTQQVTANFAANVNWTLQIQDASTNTVRHANGSGISLLYTWDGTGDGGTNIPDGVYTYLISAQTNGQAFSANLSQGSNGAALGAMLSFASSDATASADWRPTTAREALAAGLTSYFPIPIPMPPLTIKSNGVRMTIPWEDIFGAATPVEVKVPLFAQQKFLQSLTGSSLKASAPISFATGATGGGLNTPSPANTPASQESTRTPQRPPAIPGKGTVGTFLVGYQTYFNYPNLYFTTPPIPTGNLVVNKWVQLDGETTQAQAAQPQTWGANISEMADIGNRFATAMKNGRWNGSVNPYITAADVAGGLFNQANVGLLVLHGSYGSTAEKDGAKRSYLRFFDLKTRGTSYCKLDSCSFGGSGTNGLKWMGILACNVLNNSPYNSLYLLGRLPINSDLHLLLSTSTLATAAPNIGELWAQKMLGAGTNTVETVKQAWFDTGSQAYLAETNHPLTIVFRVAGWPDAFNDHLSDAGTSPGTGDPLDIVKLDATVYSQP